MLSMQRWQPVQQQRQLCELYQPLLRLWAQWLVRYLLGRQALRQL